MAAEGPWSDGESVELEQRGQLGHVEMLEVVQDGLRSWHPHVIRAAEVGSTVDADGLQAAMILWHEALTRVITRLRLRADGVKPPCRALARVTRLHRRDVSRQMECSLRKGHDGPHQEDVAWLDDE